MLGSVDDVVGWVRRWLGYAETPVNRTVFAGMAGHANGHAWCATLISAAMRQCGVPVPPKILSASSRTMFAEAKKAGLVVPAKNARPGDVVHMTRGSVSAWLGHVGIVERVEGDRLVTIEGNTNGRGSATGGGVLRHTRPAAAWNLGVWRPPYKAEKIRLLLHLPDERLCAWQGDMVGSARKVVWVPTITAAEQLLAAGYRQVDYDGPVVLT